MESLTADELDGLFTCTIGLYKLPRSNNLVLQHLRPKFSTTHLTIKSPFFHQYKVGNIIIQIHWATYPLVASQKWGCNTRVQCPTRPAATLQIHQPCSNLTHMHFVSTYPCAYCLWVFGDYWTLLQPLNDQEIQIWSWALNRYKIPCTHTHIQREREGLMDKQ